MPTKKKSKQRPTKSAKKVKAKAATKSTAVKKKAPKKKVELKSVSKPVKEPDKSKKPKASGKSKTSAGSSTAVKGDRLKIIWGVFNVNYKKVSTFAYPDKDEADKLAKKLTKDKGTTHFVQAMRVPFEEEVS